MQGKITKVLNMKPIEILSMIEEAAGTKTYDAKKQFALDTIVKKNSKLDEIERVLREDITPAIEKLKQERSAYIEFQKIEREFGYLQKVSIAYQYHTTVGTLSKAEQTGKEIDNDMETCRTRQEEIDTNIKALKEEIKKKQAEKQNDEKLNEYETKLKDIQKEETKLNSELSNKNSSIQNERKRKNDVQKLIKENENLIQTKENKLGKMEKDNEASLNSFKQAELDLKNAQKLYEGLCCGLSENEDGSLATLQEQLTNMRSKISDQEVAIKQADLKMKRALEESNKMKNEVDTASGDYEAEAKKFDKIKSQHEKLENELEKLNFNPNSLNEAHANIRQLDTEIKNLSNQIEEFNAQFPQLNFQYTDPMPNFDRSKVKGLVCNLFRVKDDRFTTAIEIAAGGKLYNVVVDNEQTAQALIDRGQLKRRVVTIPLNKIRGQQVKPEVLNTAKDLVGSNNVHSAISLVEFDPSYKPVMEFVFGSKLICTTLDGAKQVAFHPRIMSHTVTLDGDHFDPEGMLTGGARRERVDILKKVRELQQLAQHANTKKNELRQAQGQFEQLKVQNGKYLELKRSFDTTTNEFNVCKSKLEQNSHHQKLEKYRSLINEVDEKKEFIKQTQDQLKTLRQKLAELEDKLNNQDSVRERDKKSAQETIKKCKDFIEKYSQSSGNFKKECEEIKCEIEALKKEIDEYKNELAKIDEAIVGYQGEVERINESISQLKRQEQDVQSELDKRREIIDQKNIEIHSKSEECDKLNREKNAIELKLKDFEHKKKNLNDQFKDARRQIENLIENNSWIEDEKDQFGKPNTVYDFSKNDAKDLQHRLREMKNRKEKLAKQVDVRAMGMLAKKEEEYAELTKKRQIVLRDRQTLETTIEELEEIKIECLQKAFQQINKDLGSIFKTLLPGAFAKLEQCNKNSILDGVEFKVAFGDVWKESLTELSGGQRSLVALSLILSLLRYRPAPLYILDEVDAALDTSHTQNIGMMIKKHFKNSQFIIVSLKDGMFNNANVLFKTKLIDGVSTIQRYSQARSNSNKEN